MNWMKYGTLVLALLMSLLSNAQTTNDLMMNVAKGTLIDTAENNNVDCFTTLDSQIKEHRVFFSGENHRYRQTNSHLELKLFKYLHQKANVNTLILETGFSGGWIINRYVQTGDSSIKKYLFKATYKEYHHFYELLRNYYDSLPSDKKFKVEGIDLEREYGSLAKMLLYLMPDSLPKDDSLAFHWEALRAAVGYYELYDDETRNGISGNSRGYYRQSYSLYGTLRVVLRHFKNETSKYQTLLGENFNLFKDALAGLDEDTDWDRYNNAYHERIYREMYMAAKLTRLLTENPTESYYGQFGRCHTSITEQSTWCDFYYLRSLAARINSTSIGKGKVFCLGIYYLNELEYQGEEAILRDNIKGLREILKPGITLVSLEGKDSTVNKFKDKFQYLILYREGKFYEPSQINGRSTNHRKNGYDSYDPIYVNLNYAYQSLMFQSGFVKNYLSSNGFTGFKNRLDYHSVQFENVNDKGDGPYFSMDYGWSNALKQNINDSQELSLTSKKFGFYIGGDMLAHDHFGLIPAIGFHYYNTLLTKSTQKTAINNNSDPFINIAPDYIIKNPAFCVSASLDFRYTNNFYNFFIKGVYNFDVSDKRWLSDGKAISSNFKSSFSGFLLMGGLGLAIEDF